MPQAKRLVRRFTESDLRREIIRLQAARFIASQYPPYPTQQNPPIDYSHNVVTGLPGLSLPASFGVVLDNNGVVAVQSLANGQLIIGAGVGVLPSAASLTAGNGITVTPGAGSISLAANLSAGAGISVTPGNPTQITNTSPGAPASAAGQGIVFPYNFTSNQTIGAGTANTVSMLLVYIPFNLTVNSMSIAVGAGQAGSHIGTGFYTYATSQASATFLGGATFSSAVSGVITVANTAFSLTPGFYWYAWTVDTAAVTVEGNALTTATSGLFFAPPAGHKVAATATNASAAGVLPATTGVINAAGGSVINVTATLLSQ